MTQPTADPELVEVFDTKQESEALVVQGLLKTAGIDAIITNLEAPQDVLPGVGGMVVRVNAAQAQDARQLIEEHRNGGSEAADEAEQESETGTV